MTEKTMNVIRVHEAGGPEVLKYEQAPVPEPGDGEVLVRVHAVGLNPPDWYLRDGMRSLPAELRPPIDFPLILGSDISGVVATVGSDVTGFAPGDEVFGLIRFPQAIGEAYAEYVAAPASDLALKPRNVDHVDAAASAMSGLTAWQFLIDVGHTVVPPFQSFVHRTVPLGPGTRVLINGAAGGVGHIAVQLAKWRGADVTAVASGAHEMFLRGLGADDVIDYTKVSAEQLPTGFDVVVDSVGGPATGRFLRTLKPGGALLPVFFGAVDPEQAAHNDIFVSSTQVRANGTQLAQLGALLQSGDLRVKIDSTYPLRAASQAHERAERGHIQGKLVLTVA